MGLSRRLALLTAAMAIVLVLGATAVASHWSETSRLEDYRLETVELAHTLADDLSNLRPAGQPAVLARGLAAWSKDRIEETHARVFLFPEGRTGHAQLAGATDSAFGAQPVRFDRAILLAGATDVVRDPRPHPGWRALVPFRSGATHALLEVFVSTQRLADWTRTERRRAYAFALVSAALLALGVYSLIGRWVGRPLTSLGGAIASGSAAEAAGVAPRAPELGPGEFRGLARAYNDLRDALSRRERESAARAELLSLEERARGFERQALLERTADEFAHEIGTPLHTMSGHLQLLRDDLAQAGDRRGVERVGLVLSQIERVGAIVREGLDRGEWPPPRADRLDLHEIAGRVARFLEPTARAGAIFVTLEEPGAARPAAMGDARFIEHIVLNLLKNAIEALPHGGHVRLRVSEFGGQAALDVKDDGPGLAAEAQARLFTPYATTKGASGTGLGLVVSQRLARAQGGELTLVPSERGAHWRLALPLAREGGEAVQNTARETA